MNDILLYLLIKAKYVSIFLCIISAASMFFPLMLKWEDEYQKGTSEALNYRWMCIAFISFLLFGSLAIGLPDGEEVTTYLKEK